MVEPNNTTVSDNTENGALNMVKLTIDNCEVVVPEHTTILDAAKSVGIQIPTLCYLRDLNEIGGCRVCVVEVEGCDQLVAACNNYVLDGMVVHTNSPKAREARRTNVQLLLSQHDSRCTSCVRSGNCNLQTIANDLGIFYLPYEQHLAREGWDFDFPIIRDNDKCIKCMRCIKVCESVQGLGIWDLTNRATHTAVGTRGRAPIGKTDCVACGQCITHCPTGALRERDDTETVFDAIADPDKIVLVQIAPAVRSAWGEELGIPREEATVERLACALRRVGFEYVFDTDFSADLTIMEEGSELLERLGKAVKGEGDSRGWPMFTSCCPGWVRFVKARYPEFVDSLSTSKSPQQMFGAIAKSYYAEKMGLDPKDIVSVSIMPCTAKKFEITREDECGAGVPDVDIVITTNELAQILKDAEIQLEAMNPNSKFDLPLGFGTGAAVIFGVTGGVMEAALRTAVEKLTGKDTVLEYTDVRGMNGIKEASVDVNGTTVKVAVVSGLANANQLLTAIKNGTADYQFVEVMACPGGCVNGGGQPHQNAATRVLNDVPKMRGAALYQNDAGSAIRKSHENPVVKEVYESFLGEPGSEKAHELLHTSYQMR